MSVHPEILTPTQLGVLAEVGPAADRRGFALGGGTGLALLLGHRRSVDFDWFTTEPMGDAARLAAGLRGDGVDLGIEQVDRGTLHGTVAGVRVSFLEFSYPLLADPVDVPEHGCRVLSLDDIAAMKLSAIAQRGARKDFVDFYALLTRYRPLPELLEPYRRKFAVDDVGHLVYSLAYFDDAEREPLPEMIWPVSWHEMRREISRRVGELGRETPGS
jgi:hypothetical protein